MYFTVTYYLLDTSNLRHKVGYLRVPGQYSNASAENGYSVLLVIMKLHFTVFYTSSRGKKTLPVLPLSFKFSIIRATLSVGSRGSYLMGDWGELLA